MLLPLRRFARLLYNNRSYRFWAYQCLGWGGYSLATFFTITLTDNNVSLLHIGHIALQAVLGILTTWPLRSIYRATFRSPLLVRVAVSTAAIVVFSALWTALRMATFAWMSGETALWNEFHYWLFGSLFVFLSWTVLYYGIHFYELLIVEHQKLAEQSALKEAEKSKRLQAESAAREAQLKMLRYQLNPHFLFNTLNAISAHVRLGEKREAGEMIQNLSRFLRHSLDQEGTDSVTLDQELESLDLYLNIERARFGDRLTLRFHIAPEAREALVPGLILQPLVENAMKYAIAPSEDGGTVEIHAALAGGRLTLRVLDTGPGIVELDTDAGRGIGLRNTLERLSALYGDAYRFDVNNRPHGGLEVCISIPFENERETIPAEVVL